MSVMDSDQQWVKELPALHRNYLVTIEKDATAAHAADKPFFDVVFQPMRADLSSVVSVLAQLGYEYTSSVPGERGYQILLFKRFSI